MRSNLLNTRTLNYLELIGNGRRYQVPRYQRDYSWEEEQWEDLWLDIDAVRTGAIPQHYMGAIVVAAQTDRDFLVIDGQQRLATLSLFGLAIIRSLNDLAGAGHAPDENRARATELRARFIGERDPASLLESSRLALNRTDNPFYQDYLVPLRPPLNPASLPKSNRLLWDCLTYFTRKLASIAEFQTDGKKLAEMLSETVARQLLFIQITVEDEVNAYTVFETLNARGLELTTTDLLKNYLFSQIRVASDLEALERRWAALLATVGQERFPKFLRYHWLCELPQVRSERLFKLTRDRVQSPRQVFDLLAALEQRAEIFAAVLDANHGFWAEIPDARPHVRALGLFRVQQMMPLLFAAWEKFDRPGFVRVLKLTAIIGFRYSVIARRNTHPLEPAYHRAAKSVLDGAATTPAAVFAALRDIYVEDAEFQSSFATYALDAPAARNRLAKYILARFESDAANKTCDPDTDPATIEHILPQNPSEEWSATFPQNLWERSVYRLGNLTLLEISKNRDVGNLTYADKLPAYTSSAYALTRDIPALAPDEWTYARLERRQNRLAARAIHLWRSDFDQNLP